jgi:carboxypeptidase PM20D1
MLFLELNNIVKAVLVIAVIFVMILAFDLIRALKNKNRVLGDIAFESNHRDSEDGSNLYSLIQIKTTSFHDESGYHLFREKLKELFPLIHQHFIKEKIDGNAIFTYSDVVTGAPNVLFATHIDCSKAEIASCLRDGEIFGNGTYDSKSLLYVMFRAVERNLAQGKKLQVNLTIVMTIDDETTKEGGTMIVSQFLKKGKFFDLVIEEGSGIVAPSVLGTRNYFALVGIGVTGEAIIRFTTEKSTDGKQRLSRFISEVQAGNRFSSKIDSKSKVAIHAISRDMRFSHRFFLSDMLIFSGISHYLIDKQYPEISKLLKTTVFVGESHETDDEVSQDMTFELAVHDYTADILFALTRLMKKYSIEYEILSNKEASRVTDTKQNGYRIVEDAIRNTFSNLYIVPIIITKISEKRHFDKVSDCVIRFSPLFYDFESYQDAAKGIEHVKVDTLDCAINFFEYILTHFHRTTRKK